MTFYCFLSLELKMGHKKMFNGPEVNQRRSDKQNFGFVANGGLSTGQKNGNSAAAISVRIIKSSWPFHLKHGLLTL